MPNCKLQIANCKLQIADATRVGAPTRRLFAQFAICNLQFAICNLLLFVGVASAADFRTKPETRGRVTAWLDVTVAKPREPGLAEVTIVVSVEGPPGVEAVKSGIEDAVSGWDAKLAEPRWDKGDAVRWTQTITLKQKKPGQVPLPAVKVSFKEAPDAAEETVVWPDPLPRQVRGLPTPVEVPEPPSTVARWRGVAALMLIIADMLIVAVAVRAFLRRRRPLTRLTLQERMARALDAAAALMTTDVRAGHERMAEAVRGCFAERFPDVVAHHQTTTEFLEAVRRAALASDELHEFCERCDLVKFAGVRPAPEEWKHTVVLARGLVRETATANPAAAGPTPGR
jgi:hypothetical protein